MLRFTAIALTLSLALSACQTLAYSDGATVNLDDADTRATVTAALAGAVNRAHVELGPAAPDTSVVTVLPPPLGPYENHAMARPIRFDIVQRNGTCFAVRHDTQVAYALRGVSCKPAKP